MIFSRWNPGAGAYDYFDGRGDAPGINDDLPVPKLPRPTKLGVPSTSCGRPMPAGATYAGSGEMPRGILTLPAAAAPLAGDAPGAGLPPWALVAGGVLVGSLLTWAVTRRRA